MNELNNKMFELLNKYYKTGNETDEIKSLIEQGADVNAVDENGWTALNYACGEYDLDKLGNGNLKLARFLIFKGADVNAKDKDGSDALTNAAVNGNIEIAKLLIKHGAKVNNKDRIGITPLIATQFAISENQNGALQIAKLLIENYADVDIRDNSGRTALDYQKEKQEQYKNKEMIQLLKDTSTNNLFESIQGYSLYKDEEGIDLIVEHIKESLANGADINCVKDCQEEYIDEENEFYGTKQLYGYDIESATPLILAVSNRDYDLSKLLIENGADVNIRNKEGETALHIAEKKEEKEIVKLLIEHGANVFAINKNNKTVFHYTDDKDMLEFLIQVGEKQQQEKQQENIESNVRKRR